MRELSLNLLDIARNSIEAGATELELILIENFEELSVTLSDNGAGMTSEEAERALDPFFTTRVTRSLGLGLPLFKMRSELTGGSFSLESEKNSGTTVKALFRKSSPEYTELGDMPWTVVAIVSANPEITLRFRHILPDRIVSLDTGELRDKLEALPLSNPEVLNWLADYLKQQYQ